MGIFNRRSKRHSTLHCPQCGSAELGLGYVDRVRCTVLHSCQQCTHSWRDNYIDLAERQLEAARAGR